MDVHCPAMAANGSGIGCLMSAEVWTHQIWPRTAVDKPDFISIGFTFSPEMEWDITSTNYAVLSITTPYLNAVQPFCHCGSQKELF